MDHNVVVLQKMTERYLLNELDPEARNEFEEHFFDCSECAQDVQAASLFVERSKVVLAEPAEKATAATTVTVPVQRGWLAWLRPAISAPAMALLLLVIGYQNLVTLPGMSAAMNSPQVLGWTSINVSTRGDSVPVVKAETDKSFLLLVNVPPQREYARYTCDLFDSAGHLQWTLTVPAESAKDALAVRVPSANRAAG